MSCSTPRALACLTLALACLTLADRAEASVGAMSGGQQSSFRRLSLVQTVQYGGDCWYDNGWNGPGYYPCGNEWNNDLGGGAPIVGPAVRRHLHHGVIVAHPRAQNPIYPGAPPRPLGAGVLPHGLPKGVGAPAFGVGPRFRQFGAAGVHTSAGLHAGAATVSPGFVRGDFRGGLNGGNFHQFRSPGVPHIGAPITPGFAGSGGLRGPGRVGNFHGAGVGVPHIGAPVSPGLAGVGTFPARGAVGAPRIGAPASPGFAGAGAFQGGVNGLGHR